LRLNRNWFFFDYQEARMSSEDEARQLLQESGLRATSQRRTIIEVIEKHDNHLTAEDVYQEARRLNPHVSLATVYRTLAVLKDAGLIEQHYLTPEHDRSHFELAGTPSHFHFHCLGCGQIVEFESTEILQVLARDLEQKQQVIVTQSCMCVEGYCNACHQAGSEES
jgi:Fur family transcriptional regulator, ferric uptake regulator